MRILLRFPGRPLRRALERRLRRLAYERHEYSGPEYDGCIRPPEPGFQIIAWSDYITLRIYTSWCAGEFSAHPDAPHASLVRRLHGARNLGRVIWIHGPCLPAVDPSCVVSLGFSDLPKTGRPAGDEEIKDVLCYTGGRFTFAH